ncbi:MAG TPA: hypothetical protein VGK94_15855 [Candidatus Polarisedimenticolia bacterium]|jgi:hypothetical protein
MTRRPLRFGSAAALALLGAVLLQDEAAAKLPDWARVIADAAEPAPAGVPENALQVLFSETRYLIHPDGSIRLRRRFAEQALGVKAGEIGVGWFGFDETARMTATRAWHVPPGDRARRSWLPPIDVSVGGAFLDGMRLRVMAVPGIRKGSLVFFEFEAIDRPYFLSLTHLFYEGAPVKVARFEVETPPGWSVRWDWPRGTGPGPAVAGNVRAWELRDIEEPEEEPLGPTRIQRAPLLVVSAVPAQDAPFPLPAFPTWAAFSAWYEILLRGRQDPTPELKATAHSSLAQSGPEIIDKVMAAGRFVRDSVRYLAVELGIGGFQPRPAAETLLTRYGDCKDKGTLFRAILSEGGVASYPVLVNLSVADTVSKSIPSNGFDHFVVAVPLPRGTSIPPQFVPTVVDDDDLGRLLIVDTTDERTSIGSLSAHLGGKIGLVVAGDAGKLLPLPGADPGAHRIERRINVAMGPDRSLSIEFLSKYIGQPAADARAEYGRSSIKRRREIEGRVLRIWPDAAVKDYSAQYETSGGEFIETVTTRHRPVLAGGPESKASLFPGASDDVPRVPLDRRKTAVDYGHPMTLRYDVRYEGVPVTAAPPSLRETKGDGWSVRVEGSREVGAVTASWQVVLSRRRFEPEAFPELRRFWMEVTSSAGSTINLAP